MANPLDVIAQGAKLNPAFTKIVIGIPVAVAVVALSLALVDQQVETALIGGVTVLLLAFVVFVISVLPKTPGLESTIVWFVRVVLGVFVVVVTLLVTCAFFRWPVPLPCFLHPFTEQCSRIAGNEIAARDLGPATTPVGEPALQKPADAVRADYRVWVQFAGLGRETLVDLAAKLAAIGWNIPGGNRGGERIATAIGLNEVRYGSEAEKAAELLAADIAEAGFGQVKVRQVRIVTEGTLELWVSR